MISRAFLFLKNNISGYRNVFVSIVLFIFTINIVSIFLLGMSSGLNEQVTDNDNLNMMQIFRDDPLEPFIGDKELEEIKKIEGVEAAYYEEVALIDCNRIDNKDDAGEYHFTVYSVDSTLLKYYGLPITDKKTYFYADKTRNSEVRKGDKLIALHNEVEGSESVELQVTETVKLPVFMEPIIEPDASFTDPETFKKLLHNCDCYFTTDEEYKVSLSVRSDIIVIAPDVTKQNAIAKEIRDRYDNVKVSYALERASKLPAYVDTFIKIGTVILILLIIFYFISIRNSLSNVLNFRQKGIELFNVLGVEPKKIVAHFFAEFQILAIVSWLTQMALTVVAIIISAKLLDISVYAPAISEVLIGNIILLGLSICMEGYIVIRHGVNKVISRDANKV